MQTKLTSIIKLAACALIVAAAAIQVQAADKKADPNGSWKWSVPGRNGGPARENTLTLKRDGDKLTGKVSGMRGDTDITDGKVSGDNVSWVVVRNFNGNEMRQEYKGKVTGTEMKLSIAFGERTMELTAKKTE